MDTPQPIGETTLEAHLLVAAAVSRAFRGRGWDMIATGEFALEYYTQGKYETDRIDFCRAIGQKPIPASAELDIMISAGARSTGIRRQWVTATPVGELTISLGGTLDGPADCAPSIVETSTGSVSFVSPERVLVDWTFVASLPAADFDGAHAAAMMVNAARSMGTDFDWPKAHALAGSEEYRIEPFLRDFVRRH